MKTSTQDESMFDSLENKGMLDEMQLDFQIFKVNTVSWINENAIWQRFIRSI